MKVMLVLVPVPVLVLVLVLSCVSADVFHEDIAITGCSDTDEESMYGLDGEEIWYADFDKKRGVYALPPFVDPFQFTEGVYEQAVANQQICKDNLGKIRRAMKNPPLTSDSPSSPVIYNRDEVVLGTKNTLICFVTGFYPAPVKITWTMNEKVVTDGVHTNIPYPNTDGSFRQYSTLTFTPQLGDVYSCTVKHLSIKEPLTRIWDVEVKQPGVGPAVFCGVGLTVGLLGVAVGTFFLIKGNECS